VFHVKLNTPSMVNGSQSRDLLLAYAHLLRTRAVPLGLIGADDRNRIWDRHIEDSLRGVPCIPDAARSIADIGSGAGLPGVPLAIALPDRGFVLLENRQRRAAFLELAVEELGLGNVRVDAGPAEAARLQADLCLARALARPVAAWSLAARLLGSDGSLLYWAGRTWGEQDVADLAASGVVAEIQVRGTFQWQGPLVMMRARRMSAADEPGA